MYKRQVVYLDNELEMPPNKKLPARVIADLQEWIRMGAPWPREEPSTRKEEDVGERDWKKLRMENWAFRPMKKPAAPEVKNKQLVNNPIDNFILAKLESKGLKPLGKAAPRLLLRRVYLNLTGLPPTPSQVDEFLADKRPDALDHLVNSLLESPHYGERWARHWLDTARYSDGLGGFGDNGPLPGAWRYRDWVVDSFNRDLPYDQFLREQIAGDLLPFDSVAQRDRQRISAGFLVLGPKVLIGNASQERRMDVADEQLDTIGRAILGLTIGCARCHDHKFCLLYTSPSPRD